MIWFAFIAVILTLLALDLGVFNRKNHVFSIREALGWTAVWVTLGLLFAVFIYFGYENHWLGLGTQIDAVDKTINNGQSAAVKYITGFVVEKSLSVDNIFVIAMLFGYFAVPRIYQHRVLFWGILGALVMRGAMIAMGAKLVEEFHWILHLFGVFLIFTAIKMLVIKSDHQSPNENWIVRKLRAWFPITDQFHGEHFFVRTGSHASHEAATPESAPVRDAAIEAAPPGTFMLTPLVLVLVMVETTDVIFAVDSIPAVFAITSDPFIVFTSNVFAILGLRSLYFALAGLMHKFRYLKYSLSLVLLVVGAKMLATDYLRTWLGSNFNFYLLGVVITILIAGVLWSLIHSAREDRKAKT